MRYMCKQCGAESPEGIGYAANDQTEFPPPAPKCLGPHEMGRHRAPIHGPGTHNGAVLPAPSFLSRSKSEPEGLTIHEHGIAGAVITTHRTYRVSPAGWVYRVTLGDWSHVGYVTTQREALAVAVGQLCRAVDRGEVAA
jgi:hypothetical protein